MATAIWAFVGNVTERQLDGFEVRASDGSIGTVDKASTRSTRATSSSIQARGFSQSAYCCRRASSSVSRGTQGSSMSADPKTRSVRHPSSRVAL